MRHLSVNHFYDNNHLSFSLLNSETCSKRFLRSQGDVSSYVRVFFPFKPEQMSKTQSDSVHCDIKRGESSKSSNLEGTSRFFHVLA